MATQTIGRPMPQSRMASLNCKFNRKRFRLRAQDEPKKGSATGVITHKPSGARLSQRRQLFSLRRIFRNRSGCASEGMPMVIEFTKSTRLSRARRLRIWFLE